MRSRFLLVPAAAFALVGCQSEADKKAEQDRINDQIAKTVRGEVARQVDIELSRRVPEIVRVQVADAIDQARREAERQQQAMIEQQRLQQEQEKQQQEADRQAKAASGAAKAPSVAKASTGTSTGTRTAAKTSTATTAKKTTSSDGLPPPKAKRW